jgi:hypothetical protein
MFLLNGNPLAVDTAFTHNDIQYPANWLRLTTIEEKEAIGITEVPDPVRADDRFYWDGNLDNPKALEDVTETIDNKEYVTKGLKSNFISQVKQTAGSILAQTDWMVIRKAERDVAIPADVIAYRASIVAKTDELEASITAVTTVEELANLDLSFPNGDLK